MAKLALLLCLAQTQKRLSIAITLAKKRERLINQSLDLAQISQGLLKGEALTNFIKRSYEMIK